jgi:hypothetical protein
MKPFMNGDQVRTWRVRENIQQSKDCQQIQEMFSWKKKKTIEKALS